MTDDVESAVNAELNGDSASEELARVKAEYAKFRADVIRVAQWEASDRGWCDEWKAIAKRMGIRADELPPTRAMVNVKVGNREVFMRILYDRDGSVNPRQVVADLVHQLRYGGNGFEHDGSWYTVTPIIGNNDDDD